MGLNSIGPFIREFFFFLDTSVLRDLWLLKPVDSEKLIQRVDCKVIYGFSAARDQCCSGLLYLKYCLIQDPVTLAIYYSLSFLSMILT